MTLREFAKSRGFEIVGKIRYRGLLDRGCKWYTDEAGNEFYRSAEGEFSIIDKDGAVW